MARRDRTVTHSETIQLTHRHRVELEVETQDDFNLVVLNLWLHDKSEGWRATGTRLWFARNNMPDLIRAMLRALQAIEARKGKASDPD